MQGICRLGHLCVLEMKWQGLLALTPKWGGPFLVKRTDGMCCLLKDASGTATRESVHIHRLRLLIDRQSCPEDNPKPNLLRRPSISLLIDVFC